MESTTDDGRSDFDRQDLLDDFFDRAVGALQMGKPVPFPDEIRADASLTAAAERLLSVARALCGSAAPTTDVHGYTILSELGRGGMGVVYLARQERLGGRPVAIKILPSHVAGSLSARARFKAEIMSVAKQRHAGIVSVFDIVEDGETLAYIMEWVDGLTVQQVIDLWTDHPGPNDVSNAIAITPDHRMSILHERLDAKRPDESFFDFAARIGESVARALAAVHASGVIHRDVKPSNILIRRDGTPLLSDFGLAKDTSRDTLTVGAGFIGTLGYASPEQLRGEALDFRTDIFSLGATLYHLFLLVPPTTVSGVPAALRLLQDRNHIRALRASPHTPPGLASIIERAMAFDPNDRFGSAQEMADAIAAGEAIPTTASTGRRAKWISGVRWAVVPAVILAVAVPESLSAVAAEAPTPTSGRTRLASRC
jgi:eukaryotic-like serine/threonine-protein kinase